MKLIADCVGCVRGLGGGTPEVARLLANERHIDDCRVVYYRISIVSLISRLQHRREECSCVVVYGVTVLKEPQKLKIESDAKNLNSGLRIH